MKKSCRFIVLAFLPMVCLSPFATAGATFEGTVTATETYNGAASQLLYTCAQSQLRIEIPDKSKPEAMNLIDLATSRLTIVYPHNQSYVVIDLAAAPAKEPAPSLPTINSPPAVPGPHMSPPPGFPSPPPMPAMPAPVNPMAAMPMMPPPAGPALELKKTAQAKKIQGYDCALYVISNRNETMEIWATSEAALFPFYLRQSTFTRRRFGPALLEVEWAELLQKQKLFPLEAVVRTDPMSQARYSFKVDKIDKHKVENDALFKPPESYFEARAPDS